MKFVDVPDSKRIERDPDNRNVVFSDGKITQDDVEIKKIELLKKLKDDKNYKYDIEVDGGINFSNSKDVIYAGANILVSGTTIFKENNGNIKKNIETLKEV